MTKSKKGAIPFSRSEDEYFDSINKKSKVDVDSGSGTSDDEFEAESEFSSTQKLQIFDQSEDDLVDSLSEASEHESEISQNSSAIESLQAIETENSDMTEEDLSSISPSILKERISVYLTMLLNWKVASETTQLSRSEVLARWHRLVAAYYGYSDYMVTKLSGDGLFGCQEALQFFEANEAPRPVTIRCNTLKTRRRDLINALTGRGVTVEVLAKWTSVGMQVFDSPVPIGATLEYLSGQYLLQAASSLLPVQALGVEPGHRVLDMSAAPGGKTTHLAAEMKNTGILIANDASKDRLKALVANIHRMGVRNTIVCNHDGRKLPGFLGQNSFDRILLDAPCSGTGVISKDPTVKAGKTAKDFIILTHLQKELIISAIDMCAVGGSFVYSTCSVTVEENEEIVAYALQKRGDQVRLIDCNLEFGRPGFTSFRGKRFPAALKLTRRFYPHTHNMDGFFVAKFEKFSAISKKE